jgi:hypothetical protein
MKRSYSLFIATPELLTCPEIYHHAQTHTLVLQPGGRRVFSIVTPLEQPPGDLKLTLIDYDPHVVRVAAAQLMYEQGLLYITLTLEAVDVGSTTMVIDIPTATPSTLPHYLPTTN